MSDDARAVVAVRAAFDAGNFAAVRELSRARLAEEAVPPSERAILEALVSRTAPGGLATLVYAIAAAIVLGVACYWILHAHT